MKTIIVVIFTFISVCISAQNSENKFKIHSYQIGVGGYFFKNKLSPTFYSSNNGGISSVLDLVGAYRQHLVAASYTSGAEFVIYGTPNFRFNELSLLYGKELKVSNWLAFEGFAGFGFFWQNSHSYTVSQTYSSTNSSDIGSQTSANFVPVGQTISLPIQLNTKFYYGKHFGMGLNANYSLNRVNSVFSTHLVFHYKI